MNTLNKITVTDIKQLFTVPSSRGRKEEIRNRKSYGLSFCAQGKITYTINGKHFISDNKHAVILPKGKSYSIYGNESGLFPVINFDCAEPLCNEVISLPIQHSDTYIKDFEKMKALSLFEGNRAKMMGIFYTMLDRLSKEGSARNIIAPAIRHIENSYQNPRLSNTELAKLCNISEVYFRRLFAEAYKTTPKQFIVDISINKAKQLLSEGILKISAIAAQCGFTNQYHFCRIFKEKTGVTPSEYIKRKRVYKI